MWERLDSVGEPESNLSGEGSQFFAAGLVVLTGTGFAAIIGSVLITFSLSSLIEKSLPSHYSCWGNKMTYAFRKLSPWLKMDFKIPQFSVWAWGDCQIWKRSANIWYWDSFFLLIQTWNQFASVCVVSNTWKLFLSPPDERASPDMPSKVYCIFGPV